MPRRHDIDFIRVVAFALLMIYHTSLIFGTHHWLLNSALPNRAFDLIALASHPWRISLLFLISGITTATLVRHLSPGDLFGMRSRQIIPPLLFGIFVLVPPQIYVLAVEDFGLRLSYPDFWLTYVTFGAIPDGNGVPTSLLSLQHLWFLAYLWLYTLLLASILKSGAGLLGRLRLRLSRLLCGHGLLVWPILYLAALRLLVYPIFGETMEFERDWYAHIVYLSFFLAGFLLADEEAFWQAAVARRWQALSIALLSLMVIATLFVVDPPGERGPLVIALHRLARSMLQWSAILAILGICRVVITAPHPVTTYLNRAMLSYYVLHQTVVLLIAYWLKQHGWLDGTAFLPIVLATIGSCMLIYEVQRRLLRRIKAWSRGAAVNVSPSPGAEMQLAP